MESKLHLPKQTMKYTFQLLSTPGLILPFGISHIPIL